MIQKRYAACQWPLLDAHGRWCGNKARGVVAKDGRSIGVCFRHGGAAYVAGWRAK